MVWGKVKSLLGLSEPTLPDGPTRLPDYFPVEPKGCEKHAQLLFACLANEATEKARDMERLGLHQSYFSDVQVKPVDPKAVEAVAATNEDSSVDAAAALLFPKAGDNPLDECRKLVAYYQHCCDKKLKRKENLILTEHVRVQDEYRYKGPPAKA
jgi:hypothetical protein